MISQFEIIITGRVQGVGFRAAARREARAMQLKGWVENLPGGTVRAVICGEREPCTRFINWCREGSAYSWVEGIELREMKPEQLGPFTIIY
ncbi:MAG: acylphosphatase [Bacteroidales bacterium]|nr:acylphosphatase [Bacteroidales bacterium]